MEDLQKSIEQNEEIEIDLGRLLRQLRKKAVLYHRSDGDCDHHFLIGDKVSDPEEI